ncbi:hypothetical protein LU11_gp341 [Pseudomonas phage Lu11]|uniref:hypothetical protein n=1 Tax=Pseudomonas phage Lu11 TaxID=1161927 RepID=UPI00025F187F|nr:hypothetical protein LU11_gp341 [Pseudomonas phage Lu11]AFH14872.1 hypothetical protein Lu11_0334 [Pseudomonas phage Lu11]
MTHDAKASPISRKARWLIWCSVIYTVIALIAHFGFSEYKLAVEFVQLVLIIVIPLPFFIRPLGAYIFEKEKK